MFHLQEKDATGKNINSIYSYKTICNDYLRCWRVGLLLTRSGVLRDEAPENRKGGLPLNCNGRRNSLHKKYVLSAGSSMAMARDSEKYGILMLRGKLINAFSNTKEKLLKNEEIQLLFKALNISPDEEYNPKNLRYGSVAICVDSDSDGFHIGLLIMSALQVFCPQFIEEGRLKWLRSPLYIAKNGKKESYYFTDQELKEAKENNNINGELQRNKGLGSLSPAQARDSMFSEKQHMDVFKSSKEAIEKLKSLMGKDNKPRKDYIFTNIDFSEIRE